MRNNIFTGKLSYTENGWVVKYSWNHLDRGFERHETPINPDDAVKLNPLTDDNKIVEFYIITIAHGTNEYDVMDMDVAKIFSLKNLTV